MANIKHWQPFTPEDLATSSVPEMRTVGEALAEGEDQHPFNADYVIARPQPTTPDRTRTAVEAAMSGGANRFGLEVRRVPTS